MNDTREMLERAGRRFDMTEPALEQMLRRRERARRRQRVAAATVALAAAIAGIGWVVVAIRLGRTTAPASIGRPTPDVSADGWVGIALPTLAIWVALAVLGLLAFAIARLPRAATPRRSRDGRRGSSGTEPPGHGPAAPGTAPDEGGSPMDSKQKIAIGMPQATAPGTSRDELRAARVNRWLVGAVIALTAGVIALGVALIARSGDETAATPPTVGLADGAIVDMVDAMETAASTDGERFASFFAENGVMEEPSADRVTEGRAAIAEHVQSYIDLGFRVDRISPVVQSGSFVAYATSASGSGSSITILELTSDGQVLRFWGLAD